MMNNQHFFLKKKHKLVRTVRVLINKNRKKLPYQHSQARVCLHSQPRSETAFKSNLMLLFLFVCYAIILKTLNLFFYLLIYTISETER